MKRWPAKAWLLAAAAAAVAGLALPATGQEAPESLLPPGFGESPAAPPASPPPSSPAAPAVPVAPTIPSAPQPPSDELIVQDATPEDLALLDELDLPEPTEIPDASRRPNDPVGPFVENGLGPDAFAGSRGAALEVLMRRLDAPLPSRWASVLLRRALLTRAPAPADVNPVDWVAERAWLLLRMGEADGARLLVQSIDVDQFTPKMMQVAVQTALATADPAGLCPLVASGQSLSGEPVWALSEAMCAAMEGDAAQASQLIGELRRRSTVPAIDISVAEKIVGAGENARRAVTLEWDLVDRLSSWRFGLSAAAGTAIPDRLMAGSGRHVQAWAARAAMLPIESRLQAAHVAAALGVFSNPALVETYSLLADGSDPADLRDSAAERLRLAYVAPTAEERRDAIKSLQDKPADDYDRYGRLILAGAAAARLPVATGLIGDADLIVASTLAAGLDARAARWRGVVEQMEEGAAASRAWALLAVSAPRLSTVDDNRVDAFAQADASPNRHRTRLLVAALAGLGRIPDNRATALAREYGIRLGVQNGWTRALGAASARGDAGTVALLAATGMQTAAWSGVPPEHLYRITAALRRAGLDYEARMIAAEAMTRL